MCPQRIKLANVDSIRWMDGERRVHPFSPSLPLSGRAVTGAGEAVLWMLEMMGSRNCRKKGLKTPEISLPGFYVDNHHDVVGKGYFPATPYSILRINEKARQ